MQFTRKLLYSAEKEEPKSNETLRYEGAEKEPASYTKCKAYVSAFVQQLGSAGRSASHIFSCSTTKEATGNEVAAGVAVKPLPPNGCIRSIVTYRGKQKQKGAIQEAYRGINPKMTCR
jgi:hypothetical protein